MFKLIEPFDKDINKTERLLFIDIDNTFGGTLERLYQDNEENTQKWKDFIKEHNLYRLHARDIASLNPNQIKLFAEMVRDTNSKVISMSAWGSLSNPEESLRSIKTVFEHFADFPKDWLIGLVSGTGGNRELLTVRPFLKEVDFKGQHLLIDDMWKSFSDPKVCIKVDGKIGFSVYDCLEIIRKFKINVNDIQNEELRHIIQHNL